MKRRQLIGWAGMLLVPAARAHHGWQPYERVPPVYLEGEVTMILWSEPHPHLELAQRVGAPVPPDLGRRRLPPHTPSAQGAGLLARAVRPLADDRIWRVNLPEMPRLMAWDLPRPKIGDVLGVVGQLGPPETGSPTVRAAILFLGDRGYPLAAEPMAPPGTTRRP